MFDVGIVTQCNRVQRQLNGKDMLELTKAGNLKNYRMEPLRRRKIQVEWGQ